MVVGITCKQEDRYNAFMQRYRPRLAENYRAFEQHFSRTRGRAGKSATDAYVTNLAQTRGSRRRSSAATSASATRMFDEVMALPSATELPAYAAVKDLIPETWDPARRRPRPGAAEARPMSAPARGAFSALAALAAVGLPASRPVRRRRSRRPVPGSTRSTCRAGRALRGAAEGLPGRRSVVEAAMTMDNDGGWCGIGHRPGRPRAGHGQACQRAFAMSARSAQRAGAGLHPGAAASWAPIPSR